MAEPGHACTRWPRGPPDCSPPTQLPHLSRRSLPTADTQVQVLTIQKVLIKVSQQGPRMSPVDRPGLSKLQS